MDYWHLLLDLPAIVGGSSMLALLSPWRMQARAIPALLFVVAMIVMVLPTLPVVNSFHTDCTMRPERRSRSSTIRYSDSPRPSPPTCGKRPLRMHSSGLDAFLPS